MSRFASSQPNSPRVTPATPTMTSMNALASGGSVVSAAIASGLLGPTRSATSSPAPLPTSAAAATLNTHTAPTAASKPRTGILAQLSPMMMAHGLFSGTAQMMIGASGLAALAPPAQQAAPAPTHAQTTAAATATPVPSPTTNSPSSSSLVSPSPTTSTSSPRSDSFDEFCVRKTKICCTLGAGNSSVASLVALLHAGMNIARFNCTEDRHQRHVDMLGRLRTAMQESGQECALLLDTRGPEICTGWLKESPMELKAGQELLLRTDLSPAEHDGLYRGDAVDGVSVDYPRLGSVLQFGSTLKIDGVIVTRVIAILDGPESTVRGVRVRVEFDSVLGDRKRINLPGSHVDLPAVTEVDKEDLRFAAENGFHFIAASFTRHAADVHAVRSLLSSHSPVGRMVHVLAKIENQEALDNFDSILAAADGIMVARGDLGVEIPIQKVSTSQKLLIRKCNHAGKPVVTATQMLESMATNPRPTRAEATDVSNAVFDGTDAVMLSGETATGQYPIESVRVMSAICISSERAWNYATSYESIVAATRQTNINGGVGGGCGGGGGSIAALTKHEAIIRSAVQVAQELSARAIIIYSESGASARLVAKYRPAAPIILLTPSAMTHHQSRLLRGVWSIQVEFGSESRLVPTAITFAQSMGWLQTGQQQVVLLVSGKHVGVAGAANTMRILDV